MVGGDAVAKQTQDAGVQNVFHTLWRHGHAVKVRRVGDIGRLGGPIIGLAARDLDRLPIHIALEHIGIATGKHLCRHIFAHDGRNFRRGWPHVFQIDRLAIRAGAQRLLVEVNLHRACERISDNQWRRGQIIGACVWVDAAFKVAVARQHRGSNQITSDNGLGNFFGQWPRVTDTCGAAITYQVEAHGVQIRLQARLGQIIRDDLRARCE